MSHRNNQPFCESCEQQMLLRAYLEDCMQMTLSFRVHSVIHARHIGCISYEEGLSKGSTFKPIGLRKGLNGMMTQVGCSYEAVQQTINNLDRLRSVGPDYCESVVTQPVESSRYECSFVWLMESTTTNICEGISYFFPLRAIS